MSQTQAIVLLLKIGLIAGLASIVAWIAVYHALTGGGWRRNPIGLTLVVEAALVAARDLGFPLMLKAVAGGGGRGMRVARDADELARVFPIAQLLAHAGLPTTASRTASSSSRERMRNCWPPRACTPVSTATGPNRPRSA